METDRQTEAWGERGVETDRQTDRQRHGESGRVWGVELAHSK
jgi:hypothetical protein